MDRLILLDANAIIHRSFHALPPLTSKRGELVNAVYGFISVFIKVIRELKPNYLAACFDLAVPTFRHKQYEEYKAKRLKAPQELYDQIPLVQEFLKAFNIPIFSRPGYEADDLIGTLAYKAVRQNPHLEVIIATGDLDTLQLISDKIQVWFLRQGLKESVLQNEETVFERFRLKPEQMADFKGLKGDPSDNIPGVPGIGEKTAINLLNDFQNLEGLYEALESQPQPALLNKYSERIKNLLQEYKDQAFFSKYLASIQVNIDLDFQLSDLKFSPPDGEKLKPVFDRFGFRSLYQRLKDLNNKKEQKTNLKDKSSSLNSLPFN